MSSFSRTSNKNHYRGGHYGSSHYQKKGLLGNLLNMIASRSRSGGFYNGYVGEHNNQPIQNPHSSNQNTVSCSKCNSQVPAGSKFCLECGEKVNTKLFCLDCGEEIPVNAKFCSNCGSRLNR